MTYPLPLKILGLGHHVPSRVVPSSELEARLGLQDGWITKKQGVRQRHWVADETNSSMGAAAAREALRDAGLEPGDLDLILNASGSQEQAIPDGGALIQRQLGLGDSGIAAFSVHATCLSFLVALDAAASFLATGRYSKILVVSSEIASHALNFDQTESSTLFGDGAAAAVVGKTPDGETSCVHAARFETYGEGAYFTQVAGGGTRRHPNDPKTEPNDNLFYMDGPAVFSMAVKRAPGFLERLQPGLSKGLGEIKIAVPHQARQASPRSTPLLRHEASAGRTHHRPLRQRHRRIHSPDLARDGSRRSHRAGRQDPDDRYRCRPVHWRHDPNVLSRRCRSRRRFDMAVSLLMILLAGSVGSLAPQPARAFTASSVRAGVTVGAMYMMMEEEVILTPPNAGPTPVLP